MCIAEVRRANCQRLRHSQKYLYGILLLGITGGSIHAIGIYSRRSELTSGTTKNGAVGMTFKSTWYLSLANLQWPEVLLLLLASPSHTADGRYALTYGLSAASSATASGCCIRQMQYPTFSALQKLAASHEWSHKRFGTRFFAKKSSPFVDLKNNNSRRQWAWSP